VGWIRCSSPYTTLDINSYKGDISIYPINPNEKFFNPSTSYYVIQEIPGVDSVKK